MNTGPDALLTQALNEFVAVDPQPVQIEPENVKVPRMAARWRDRGGSSTSSLPANSRWYALACAVRRATKPSSLRSW